MSVTELKIKTFTGSYEANEDRIRLNAVDDGGVLGSIYLTRRLVDRVIPIVLDQLTTSFPSDVGVDVFQTAEHEIARLHRSLEEPAEPVAPANNENTWLCTTVHIHKNDVLTTLEFTDQRERRALLALNAQQLRATLDIFRDLYTRAEWDAGVFPDWQIPRQSGSGIRRLN